MNPPERSESRIASRSEVPRVSDQRDRAAPRMPSASTVSASWRICSDQRSERAEAIAASACGSRVAYWFAIVIAISTTPPRIAR